jgi:hypothetical protein
LGAGGIAAADEEGAGGDAAAAGAPEGTGVIRVDPGPEGDKRDVGAVDKVDEGARPEGRPGMLGRPMIDLLSPDKEAPPRESEYVVGTLACES